MTYLEIKPSRLKYMLLAVAAMGFVVTGIVLVMNDGPAWIGWGNIVFFGAGIPIFLWQFAHNRPRLIIDDEGVLDRTLGVGKIYWNDISGAFLKSIKGNDFICLELIDSQKYLGKLSSMKKAAARANEKLGFTPLSLNLIGLSSNTYQVLELVLKMTESNKQ